MSALVALLGTVEAFSRPFTLPSSPPVAGAVRVRAKGWVDSVGGWRGLGGWAGERRQLGRSRRRFARKSLRVKA